MVGGLTNGSYHYKTSAGNEAAAPRMRAVRLAKEVASLESLLPLHPSSSIFVRVDEAKVQVRGCGCTGFILACLAWRCTAWCVVLYSTASCPWGAPQR